MSHYLRRKRDRRDYQIKRFQMFPIRALIGTDVDPTGLVPNPNALWALPTEFRRGHLEMWPDPPPCATLNLPTTKEPEP